MNQTAQTETVKRPRVYRSIERWWAANFPRLAEEQKMPQKSIFM